MTQKRAAKKRRKSPTFAVESRPIGQVTHYAANPRHNTDAIAKVARSLSAFGWRQPIVVDRDGIVVVGHTRLEAARSLGMTHVPVHVAFDLTPTQAKAYRLADNRTGEEATWNDDLLAEELRALEGDELLATGFDDDELSRLLTVLTVDAATEDDREIGALPTRPVTVPGDVITLGPHRLVCGDATDATAWEKLLGDELADCVWTDPPYGVNYQQAADDRRVADSGRLRPRGASGIENDALSGDGLRQLLRDTFALVLVHSRRGASVYTAAPPGPPCRHFIAVLDDLDILRQILTWVKDAFVMGRSDYHYRHEFILYGWTPGAAHHAPPNRTQDTVWECPRPRASKEHPTMKPVALVQRALENSTDSGEIIVDQFAGSGSTLMASEASGRRARLIELDPRYCDVIVSRWEAATGQRAVR